MLKTNTPKKIKLTEGSGRTERDVEITPEMDEGIKALMKSNYVNKQSDLETRNNLESWIDNNRGIFTKSQVQNQQAIYNKTTALDLSTKQKTSLNLIDIFPFTDSVEPILIHV